MMSKQAVILAGGLGLRLQERTKQLPKALLEIGQVPIIDCVIHHLLEHQVDRIIIAGGYRVGDLQQHVVNNVEASGARGTFNSSSSTSVPNWDGKTVVVDVTSLLANGSGWSDANCDVEARLTITPTSENQGSMLLEFIFTNCAAALRSFQPQVFENCGDSTNSGPHVVSEMSIFSLDGLACV